MFERPRSGERAVLVRLGLGAAVDPEDLQEFTELAPVSYTHLDVYKRQACAIGC